MNFSDLRVKKKIEIIDGVATLVEEKINGEINLKNINLKLVKEINENVVQKLTGNESDEEVAYLIFPYLTDIHMDVTLEEFLEIMTEPSDVLILIQESIMDTFNNLLDLSEKITALSQKSSKLKERLPEVQTETVEEKLNKLYDELSQEKDSKKRDKIFNEITRLKNMQV